MVRIENPKTDDLILLWCEKHNFNADSKNYSIDNFISGDHTFNDEVYVDENVYKVCNKCKSKFLLLLSVYTTNRLKWCLLCLGRSYFPAPSCDEMIMDRALK